MKAISNDSTNLGKPNYVNYDNNNTINASHKSPPMVGLVNSSFSVVSLKSPTSSTPTFPWQQQPQSQQQALNLTQSVITTTPLNQAMSNSSKQVFRNQSVMVSNKLVQNLNRNVQSDPVQYVVKNSPNNQRIVILTKPPTASSSTTTNAMPSTSNIHNNYNNNDLNRAPIHLTDTSNNNNNNNNNILIPLVPGSNNENVINSNNSIIYTMSSILNQNSSNKVIKPNTVSSHLMQQNQFQNNNNNNNNNSSILKPITLIPVNNLNKDKHLVYKFNSDLINNNNNTSSFLLNGDNNNNFSGIQNFNLDKITTTESALSSNVNNKMLEISEAEIEISTSTVEIDSSEIEIETCEVECAEIEEEMEVKEEINILPKEEMNILPKEEMNILLKEENNNNQPALENLLNIKRRNSNRATCSKNSQKSDDVTRCICGLDHDDGYMICCDKCLVWQHLVCMGVNRKKIPNKFFCEKCQPRSVNLVKAVKLQNKYLSKKAKKSNNNEEEDTSDVEDENDTENEETRKELPKSNNVLRSNSNSNNNSTLDFPMTSPNLSINSVINLDEYLRLDRRSELDGQNDETVPVKDDESLKKQTKQFLNMTEQLENASIETNNNKENGDEITSKSVECSLENKKETIVIKKKYRAKTIREELEKSSSNELANPTIETTPILIPSTPHSPVTPVLACNLEKKIKLKKNKLNYEYSEEFLKLRPLLIANSPKYANLRQSLNINSNQKTGFLKLVKINNKDEILTNEKIKTTSYRIKSNQTLKSNEYMGEYVGRVMKLEEYENRENPFVLFYSILNGEVICIDSSSSFKNVTRFIRKSCVSNCELRHFVEEDGNIHFLLFSTKPIEQGAEVTLPFDINRISINKENFQHFTCSCGKKKCKINEHRQHDERLAEKTNKAKCKNNENSIKPAQSTAAKRKRENSTDNSTKKQNEMQEEKSASLLVEKIKKEPPKETEVLTCKKQQTSTNEAIASCAETKSIKKENSNISLTDTTSKNLSREDRKLMSYMRVIEKLEKQGLKKKELKQPKSTPEKEPQDGEIDSKKDAKKSGTSQVISASKTIIVNETKTTRTTNQDEEKAVQEQANDNEIAAIIENGQKMTKSKDETSKSKLSVSASSNQLSLNSTNFDVNINKSVVDEEKPLVKSPDFSFVNLSIKPRQTLNFLQRNLSSSSPSSLEHADFFTYDHFRISVDTTSSTFKQTESALSSPTSSQQQQQQNVFNPKKYWLKCSSVNSEIAETCNQSPTQCTTNSNSNISNQPLKKRRHLFQDCEDSPQHSSFNDASSDYFSGEIGYEQKGFASTLLLQSEIYTNNITPLQQSNLTPLNESPLINPQSNNFIGISESEYASNYLQNQNLINEQKTQSFVDISINSTETASATAAAEALEAQKRKKVSLADYRRRKETRTNSNTDFNEVFSANNTLDNKNNEYNTNSLHEKEDLEIEAKKVKNEIPISYEIENASILKRETELNSDIYKSKISIKLNEILEKKSNLSPSSSTLRLSSYLFEEKQQPNPCSLVKENVRLDINLGENSKILPLESSSELARTNSLNEIKEKKIDYISKDDHLNIDINTDEYLMSKTSTNCQEEEAEIFFNNQSTPIPKSNLPTSANNARLDFIENYDDAETENEIKKIKKKKSSKKSTALSDCEFEDNQKSRRSRSINRSHHNKKSPSRSRRSLSRASSSINSSNTSTMTNNSSKFIRLNEQNKPIHKDSEKSSPNLSLASRDSLTSFSDDFIEDRKSHGSKKQNRRYSISPVKLSDIKEKKEVLGNKRDDSKTKINENSSKNRTYDYDEGELDTSSLSGRSRNAYNFNSYNNDFETDNNYYSSNRHSNSDYHYFERNDHSTHHHSQQSNRKTKCHIDSHRSNRSIDREYSKSHSQLEYHNYLQYSPDDRDQAYLDASHSQRYNYFSNNNNHHHFYRESSCTINERYLHHDSDLDPSNYNRYKSQHYAPFDQNVSSYHSRNKVRSLSRDSRRRRSHETNGKKYSDEEMKAFNNKNFQSTRSKSRSGSPYNEERKKNKIENSQRRLNILEFDEYKKQQQLNEYSSEKEHKSSSKSSSNRKRYEDDSAPSRASKTHYKHKEINNLENEKRYDEENFNEYDYYDESNHSRSKYHNAKLLPKFDLRYHLNKNFYSKNSEASKQMPNVIPSKSSISTAGHQIDSLNNSFESLTPQNSTKTSSSLNTTSSTSSMSSNTSNLSNYSTSSSSSLIDTSCTETVTSRKTINLEKIKKRHLPLSSTSTNRSGDIKRLKE
jgi:hypothetical protein